MSARSPWKERPGVAPWSIPRTTPPRKLDRDLSVDFAVVGAGFTGLTLALSLGHLLPGARVGVLEKAQVGAGAGGSGTTGGMALEGTAAGELPEGVSALSALRAVLEEESIECRLRLGGAYELSRSGDAPPVSPLRFQDGGELRPRSIEPGGDLDPGLYLGGLLRAALRRGAEVWEETPVLALAPHRGRLLLEVAGGRRVEARCLVLATEGLRFPGTEPDPELRVFQTFALATAPLGGETFEEMGWADRLPFETLDRPFLWGRTTEEGRAIVGAGLAEDPAEGPERCAELERRFRGLHPSLREATITHAWWGPVAFLPGRKPRLEKIAGGGEVWVVGCYAGHGVALSALFGRELARHLAGLPSALGRLAEGGALARG